MLKSIAVFLFVAVVSVVGCATNPAVGPEPTQTKSTERGAVIKPGEGFVYKFKDKPDSPVTCIVALGYVGKHNENHLFQAFASFAPPRKEACMAKMSEGGELIVLVPIMALDDLTRQWVNLDRDYCLVFLVHEVAGGVRLIPQVVVARQRGNGWGV